MAIVSNHNVVKMSPRVEDLAKLFKGKPGMIQLQPKGWALPLAFERYSKDIKEFPFYEDDTILMTMPKSGTTWIQEILWTMKNNAKLDHPMASVPLNRRSPFLEVDTLVEQIQHRGTIAEMFSQQYPDFDQSYGMGLHVARKAPRPRVIKTHLSFSLISDSALSNTKIVYVIRDPRDVCISYHHHCRIFKYEDFQGTFDQFVDAFIEGAVTYAPYWAHVKAAWERRNHPNLHILFYEKMKKNTKEEFMKLSKFLGLDISDAQMDKIIEYTSFSEMKKRDIHVISPRDAHVMLNLARAKEEGGFFRQGTSGSWKSTLNEDQKEKFNVWIEKNCFDKVIMENITNL